MRKIIGILTLVLLAQSMNAQNDYGGSGAFGLAQDYFLLPGIRYEDAVRKNSIKFNAASVIATSINVGYERALTEKLSMALYGRYRLSDPDLINSIGLDYFTSDFLVYTDDYNKQFSELNTGFNFNMLAPTLDNAMANLDVRYYMIGRNLTGFFAGPYFRYRKLGYTVNFEELDGTNQLLNTYSLDGQASTNSAGFHLGFNVATGFIGFELIFGGVHFGSTIGDITASNTGGGFNADFQQYVTDGIQIIKDVAPAEFEVPLNLKTVNSNEVLIETRTSGIGFRLPSLSINFNF